jgi:hypothetical protein
MKNKKAETTAVVTDKESCQHKTAGA